MNIVLYVNSFLPAIGGRELVVHHLALAFQELGHRVRVVGPSGWWSQRGARLPYRLHRWPYLAGFWPDLVQGSWLLLDTLFHGCDVVHAHSTYPCGYAAARLKALRRLPVVITPHGEDIHTVSEIGFGQRLDPVQRAKIDYAVRKADLLTAISGSVEGSLLEAGAHHQKIRRIPNGVDLGRFARPSTGRQFRELSLPASSRIIITVGNYRPIKGHEVLIRAMPTILREEPDARLVIVGRTSQVLETLVAASGLEDAVRFTGVIELPSRLTGHNGTVAKEEDPLADLYAASEVYVSSGIGEGAEGLSLAVLEAMAAGLPVVATDISGNKDVVEPGDNGYLVPPGDPAALAAAILRVLKNPGMRGAMASNARAVAARFGWKEIARRYLDVYREAMDTCRPSSG